MIDRLLKRLHRVFNKDMESKGVAFLSVVGGSVSIKRKVIDIRTADGRRELLPIENKTIQQVSDEINALFPDARLVFTRASEATHPETEAVVGYDMPRIAVKGGFFVESGDGEELAPEFLFCQASTGTMRGSIQIMATTKRESVEPVAPAGQNTLITTGSGHAIQG